MTADSTSIVESVIKARKTTKVLAPALEPKIESSNVCSASVGVNRAELERLVSIAGWAPFHRACDEIHRNSLAETEGTSAMNGIEPWRFFLIDNKNCRNLISCLPQEGVGKIPAMLRTAEALVLATWLPNPPNGMEMDETANEMNSFEPTLANMEHIAAASAAIQNLLLAATDQGIPNYWSSGGVLRSQQVFDLLDIPQNQILLGALFLFPAEPPMNATIVGSKLRDKRSPATCWSRWLKISEHQE